MPEFTVRPRVDADLPELGRVMAAQQPFTRYPVRWPLPMSTDDFIRRASEIGAWVADVDGRPVGHVSVTEVDDPVAGDEAPEFVRVWSQAAGRPATELACISVLFVDHELRGRGIGGALLDHAVAQIRRMDRTPVLDVVDGEGAASAVYRHRGWVEVGRLRFSWVPEDWEPATLMILPG